MSSASLTTTLPTSAVALTTVFTPAATCSGLTFSSPSYSIWFNEPVPAPTITESGCYPSQWLSGYTSLSTSSIAVALNPLVCPLGWTTALNSTSSYIACCPTGYAVHPPETTVDPQRPVYGGLCFSGFTAGASLTVAEYNATGLVQTQTVPFSSSGQVFAHVIDGYATQHVMATSSATSNTAAAPATSTATATAAVSKHKSLSGGAIAGIVVGCIVAAIAALAIGYFFLRRRQQKMSEERVEDSDREGQTNEAGGALIHESDADARIHESDAGAIIAEKDGFPTAKEPGSTVKTPAELSSGTELVPELESPPIIPEPVELDTPFNVNWNDREKEAGSNENETRR